MPVQDPLFNARDAASRELVRYGVIYDCFGTNFPLIGLMRAAGVSETLFRGTGVLQALIYDYALRFRDGSGCDDHASAEADGDQREV
jgi:hypothetical protein